jgi:hypothetical protein
MRIALLVLSGCLVGCAATAPGAGAVPGANPVSMRDFFFYSCVREYMLANAITMFDNSTAYGVEYSTVSHETLSKVRKAAKDFAATIGPPDYSDPEHGRPALLAACLEESRSARLDPIVAPAPDATH